jgi:hypothetical protein
MSISLEAAGWLPPLSHLTTCTAARSNLKLSSEHNLYRLLTVHIPIHFPLHRSFQRIPVIPRPCVTFRNKPFPYDEEMLARHQTLKPKQRPFSAVRDCFSNVFAAILHIWRPFPSFATWRRAMHWWLKFRKFILLSCISHKFIKYGAVSSLHETLQLHSPPLPGTINALPRHEGTSTYNLCLSWLHRY